ncbi:hypothetical protein D2Q93_15510 [Alicyclobacillaceae bacterium I2511]|nr:hypothetical protein D2Q93_15510 [Alicyclobacillaceae bacterium I2511]
MRWPVNVNVISMSQNSLLIFGPHNVVYGLSSHEKANTGFGSVGSHNVILQNVSIVYDPDGLDTPIDDRDINIYAPVQPATTAPVTNIGFESIQVNAMSQNSAVFVGDTKLTGMDTHEKDNVGYGWIYGNGNVEVGNVNVNYDPDGVDTIISDQDMKSSVFYSS